MAEKQGKTQGASSSRKVLQILDYFSAARPKASIDELAGSIKVPKSTAYRYVSLLKEQGLVGDDGRGRYHLTQRMAKLAAAARAAVTYVDVARPYLDRLRDETDETALLVQRISDNAVCVARSESNHPIRLSYEVGASFPLHRGAAPGKILLAYWGETERASYLSRHAREIPAAARSQLIVELATVNRKGIATAVGEIIPDVWGIAAPVFESGKLVAALSVAGPAYRLTAEAKKAIQSRLTAAATELTESLGLA